MTLSTHNSYTWTQTSSKPCSSGAAAADCWKAIPQLHSNRPQVTCHLRETSGWCTYSFLSVLWTLEGTKCDRFYHWTPFTLLKLEKNVLGKLYQSVKFQLTKELGREDGGHSQNLCTWAGNKTKQSWQTHSQRPYILFSFFFNLTTM